MTSLVFGAQHILIQDVKSFWNKTVHLHCSHSGIIKNRAEAKLLVIILKDTAWFCLLYGEWRLVILHRILFTPLFFVFRLIHFCLLHLLCKVHLIQIKSQNNALSLITPTFLNLVTKRKSAFPSTTQIPHASVFLWWCAQCQAAIHSLHVKEQCSRQQCFGHWNSILLPKSTLYLQEVSLTSRKCMAYWHHFISLAPYDWSALCIY